jgi:hypothetical protein
MYNEEVLDVHNKFMEVIEDFNIAVREKNEEDFMQLASKTKQYF